MDKQVTDLLPEIERFIERHSISATAFGLAAVNDGHFVRDLRDGKDVRLSTANRVRSFMSTYKRQPRTKTPGDSAEHAA